MSCNRSVLTCVRKVPHKTLDTAEKEAKRLTKLHGVKIVAYQCLVCYRFHCGKN